MKSYQTTVQALQYTQAQSADIYTYTLTASTPQSITVPTGAKIAVFTATGPFFLSTTGTASLTFAHSGGDSALINNTAGGTAILVDSASLSIIASGTPTVSVAFYMI